MVLYRFNNFNGRNIRLNGGNMKLNITEEQAKTLWLVLDDAIDEADMTEMHELQQLVQIKEQLEGMGVKA